MAAMSEKQEPSALENAGDIIERFGGIRPMATKMGVPVTTVQGWKKRNVIPGNRRDDVIEAAGANNIDIADLLKAGAANQNTGSVPPQKRDFESTLTLANRHQDGQTEARHSDAIAAGRVTAAQDEIIKTIRAAEKRAIKTSTWFSIALVTGVCAMGAILLWPTKQQVTENTNRVAALETRMDNVTEGQGFLKRLIPEDMAERFGNLQQQAADIQARIANTTAQAEALAGGLLSTDVGDIGARLSALEQQLGGITGMNPDLAGLIDRLKGLQQTDEGMAQLSTSVADLNMLVENMRGRVDQIDGALVGAQQEDDALGQTLEGVSPTDLRAAAMLLGLAQFRSSLHRNAPFEEDLLLLKGLVSAEDVELHAAIDRLAPRAAEGVLTPAGLSTEFKGLAGDIVVSSLKGEDVSIQEKAKARLNEIMQVQKDGELVTGTDTQATVARAQQMLDAGDVTGAIAELQSLEGPAAETAQPFMDEAMATLTAEKVKEMMTGKVLSQLGGMNGGAAKFTVPGGLDALLGELGDVNRKVISNPNSNIKIMTPAAKGPFTP